MYMLHNGWQGEGGWTIHYKMIHMLSFLCSLQMFVNAQQNSQCEWLQDIEAEDSVEGSQHPITTNTVGSEDSDEIRGALMHYFVPNSL